MIIEALGELGKEVFIETLRLKETQSCTGKK